MADDPELTVTIYKKGKDRLSSSEQAGVLSIGLALLLGTLALSLSVVHIGLRSKALMAATHFIPVFLKAGVTGGNETFPVRSDDGKSFEQAALANNNQPKSELSDLRLYRYLAIAVALFSIQFLGALFWSRDSHVYRWLGGLLICGASIAFLFVGLTFIRL